MQKYVEILEKVIKTDSYNIKPAIKAKTFLETLMFQRVQASAHAKVEGQMEGEKLKTKAVD